LRVKKNVFDHRIQALNPVPDTGNNKATFPVHPRKKLSHVIDYGMVCPIPVNPLDKPNREAGRRREFG
jgi:hypothetical protein